MLASVTFDCPLWSVADPSQNFLCVGGDNGLIYETNLFEKKSLMNLENNREVVFKCHEYVKVKVKYAFNTRLYILGAK